MNERIPAERFDRYLLFLERTLVLGRAASQAWRRWADADSMGRAMKKGGSDEFQ